MLAVASIAIVRLQLERPAASKHTGRQLDLTIVGPGFFEVSESQTNQTFYTRHGAFAIGANGDIEMLYTGHLLEPRISIPHQADVTVSTTGEVYALYPEDTARIIVGHISLSTFDRPDKLQMHQRYVYMQTEESGVPTTATPGEDGLGLIQEKWLEYSPQHLRQSVLWAGWTVTTFITSLLLYKVWKITELLNQVDIVRKRHRRDS